MLCPILVFLTHPEKTAAKILAHKIVESQCGACVQILDGITSIYKWNNVIEENTEVMMIVKTFAHQFSRLQTLIIENHPYNVPEIVSIKMENVSEDYLKWMNEVLE